MGLMIPPGGCVNSNRIGVGLTYKDDKRSSTGGGAPGMWKERCSYCCIASSLC